MTELHLHYQLHTRIHDPESSLFIGLVRPEVDLDRVGAGVYDVIGDVISDARAVSPALSTGNDKFDPVRGTEVTRKTAELRVEDLQEDFSGAMPLQNNKGKKSITKSGLFAIAEDKRYTCWTVLHCS